MTKLIDQNYTLAEDIVARTNNDGSFILMKMDESSTFFKIEGVASYVWQQMNEGQTLPEIMISIEEQFDVAKDQLENDVEGFLSELIKRELITPQA